MSPEAPTEVVGGAAQADTPPPASEADVTSREDAERRRLPVVRDDGERVEPRVRGEALLRVGQGVFQRVDRLVSHWLPAELNPFAQTGAIANTTFITAIVSGIVLLIWYRTSVHEAHASVVAMDQARFGAGLVRSLHRYSSDAALLFMLLHAAKLFFERRFGGSRWLAWVTGMTLVGLLWLDGWLGYWLVWDQRGQLVALGSARVLDALPIFADPLSRSFLADDRLNSLLFFVVFFLHMLLPLAMGIALWLHITRLSRPWFLTKRVMTAWVLLSLVVVSAVFPADTGEPARMAVQPEGFAMDHWYLAPIWLTDRLGGGVLWAIVLGSGALLFPIPWLLARGRARVATVVAARCNACEKCYQDCPYDAIQMVERADEKPYPSMASIDPGKCVGCGICAGSCDSAGIGLEWFDSIRQRHRIDELVDTTLGARKPAFLALVCNESAGGLLDIDEATACSPSLPGYVVVRVPCAGWVHPLTVERALRRGARGVLVVASGPGSCTYREGNRWTVARMAGTREPSLRFEKVDRDRVRVLELYRTEQRRLVDEARRFAESAGAASPATPSRTRRVLAGLALGAVFGLVTWAGTAAAYRTPSDPSPKLVISFKHPGKAGENCREPTAAELEKLPRHMRQKQICERRRASVRLRVEVDGKEVARGAHEPRGIWGDGNSIAVERFKLSPGEHTVKVELGDSADPSEVAYSTTRRITLRERHNAVLLFDRTTGFVWYE
jgi:coenzyme F420-reducing hydrogenase delta subunit/quinol-cytochrome oxidoreductase complex cytochrome b subunit/Pyruvate/2-oxoacid:ferredoxin oxidoreductase delta subunit